MARALCNASFAAALSDGIALFISRRGYSAAAVVVGRKSEVEEKAAAVRGKRDGVAVDAVVSWVPDPVTGYYRPANRTSEIDPAELREMLLSQK